ncbi:facilitated trehalose transporter Tret1 isoform X2 [Halyomorpha halys]|uniref:facilitated trehalose transporter Tret1 isoform X2 n=1 Tax=Halyomorpha halys TaxID=286706 RepID=UPI0034D31F5C
MSDEAYRRFKTWQICTTLAGYLSMVMAGISMTWPSPLTAWYSSKDSEVPMTEHEVSWMVSIVAIGAGFASIPCGMLADIFGRKTILLGTGITSALSWLLIMVTRSKWALFVAQILGGIVLGGAPSVAPIYISEISPPHIRGAIVGQLNTMFFVGQLLVYAVGPQLSYTNYIRACASVPVLFFIFFGFAPESPYYLLSKGREEEAKDCMTKLRGKDSLGELEASKQEHLEKDSMDKLSIWEMLKTNNYMKNMICLQILSSVNQLNGSATISLYTMEFLGGKWVAIEMGFITVVSSFFGSMLSDPFGRRPVLMVSQVGCAVSTILLFFHFHFMDLRNSKLFLYFGVFGFSFISSGMSFIMLALPSELFGTSLRAFVNGLTQTVDAIACFIALKIFFTVNITLGIETNFIIYTLVSFSGLIAAMFIPETARQRISQG